MIATTFIRNQIVQLKGDFSAALRRKSFKALRITLTLPLYAIAVPAVLSLRLLRCWLEVRIGRICSEHVGHMAGNTEIFLCERDAGIGRTAKPHLDLLYMGEGVSNDQLARMWIRAVRIWPYWLLSPLDNVDHWLPGTRIARIFDDADGDRDIHSLLELSGPHLTFTPEEEARGEEELRRMGVPSGMRFVCLNVRDSAYEAHVNRLVDWDWSHSTFRNSAIHDYRMAAEALADRGLCVIRVGAKVLAPLESGHPGVIDYATNGTRSDFMDIYLGAKCHFCLSVGSGFDSVPIIFRRPVAYVNMAPVGYLATYLSRSVAIFKTHVREADGHALSLAEIFAMGVGHEFDAPQYPAKGVRLVDNTPEEIRDLALEMTDRLEGVWRTTEEDEMRQERFWEIFPAKVTNLAGTGPLHGQIRLRIGAAFLGNRPGLIDAA